MRAEQAEACPSGGLSEFMGLFFEIVVRFKRQKIVWITIESHEMKRFVRTLFKDQIAVLSDDGATECTGWRLNLR